MNKTDYMEYFSDLLDMIEYEAEFWELPKHWSVKDMSHWWFHVKNLPSEDEVDDATRVNQIIERQLRIAPTQYMWFHRRFKTRPEGYEKIY